MSSFNIAQESHRSKAARERLETYFRIGKDKQADLVKVVANTHIRDKLVSPKAAVFSCRNLHQPRIHYGLEDRGGAGTAIHAHALGQMCSVAQISRAFVGRLIAGQDWERELFSYNMNQLFHLGTYLDRSKNPTKFLHRIVGLDQNAEVRGFLSRNFNRHLASLPLLRGFVEACHEVGAHPVEASASSVRFSLKCFLPYVFEPVVGEFVSFGQAWSNSDFGAGRHKVSLCVMRISGGTTAVLEDNLSRVHIGSIIQDSDLELSDETAAKEVDAQVSAIRDSVLSHLGPDPVNRLLQAIAVAHAEEIPWHRIKSEMGRLLQKGELQDVKRMLEGNVDDIIDLPSPGKTADGDAIPTRWWASNVVSWFASRETNPDRAADLQQLAGDLLKAS